ncbi:AT-hook motif nuclear-localized protein 1-like [Bidens hawaiensis]|uniref:AT-hook motif nuclear-localized protein 1-like n=1 Tax=Bidens hawaiensis TaxID=980011 RepID=UPI00404A9CAB
MEEDNHDSGEFVQPPPEVFRSTAVGFKKKRGRPRNYTVALSPMPISASIPPTGGWKYSQEKPYVNRKQKLEFCTPTVRFLIFGFIFIVFDDLYAVGEQVAYSYGPNFTPHVVTVNFGEDVNMKIISFAQQGSKAICVLAANGSISNVTLRQPDSSGGTLTYEGRFDILSLSGAFVSNDCGGAKGLSGGMSVSLAGPDGRVLGGGLAGMLVAAGPIQVILGSFLQGHQQEQQNVKKSRFEFVPTISPPVMAATPIFKETTERARGDEPNINFTITSPTRGLGPENNGSEPKVVSTSMFGASC